MFISLQVKHLSSGNGKDQCEWAVSELCPSRSAQVVTIFLLLFTVQDVDFGEPKDIPEINLGGFSSALLMFLDNLNPKDGIGKCVNLQCTALCIFWETIFIGAL